MTLEDTSKPATKEKYGSDNFVVPEGKSLKDALEEKFSEANEEVPEGKQWEVFLTINIVETDA